MRPSQDRQDDDALGSMSLVLPSSWLTYSMTVSSALEASPKEKLAAGEHLRVPRDGMYVLKQFKGGLRDGVLELGQFSGGLMRATACCVLRPCCRCYERCIDTCCWLRRDVERRSRCMLLLKAGGQSNP